MSRQQLTHKTQILKQKHYFSHTHIHTYPQVTVKSQAFPQTPPSTRANQKVRSNLNIVSKVNLKNKKGITFFCIRKKTA